MLQPYKTGVFLLLASTLGPAAQADVLPINGYADGPLDGQVARGQGFEDSLDTKTSSDPVLDVILGEPTGPLCLLILLVHLYCGLIVLCHLLCHLNKLERRRSRCPSEDQELSPAENIFQKVYRSVAPAFYGLRKIVRRKLSFLALRKQRHRLMKKLAKCRIEDDEKRIAFFYNDAPGDPLLVVKGEMKAGLTQTLEPILADVKGLVGSGCRITVIFDRGGFSFKLFSRLIEAGFDVITYRKGKVKKLFRHRFHTVRRRIDGKWHSYEVCDQDRVKVRRLRKRSKKNKKGSQFLRMRQVTVLRDDGRQTNILTNRQDLDSVELVYRMFGRWRQEDLGGTQHRQHTFLVQEVSSSAPRQPNGDGRDSPLGVRAGTEHPFITGTLLA